MNDLEQGMDDSGVTISGVGGIATPPSSWATRFSGILKSLFSPSGNQPIPDIKNNEVDTRTPGVSINPESEYLISQNPENWKLVLNRRTIWLTIESMDDGDELVSLALDITADAAIGDVGLQPRSENPEVERILRELFRRINADYGENAAWHICRDMAKHGHKFYEVVIDRTPGMPKISDLKPTADYQIYPALNNKGVKLKGWYYRTDQDIDNNKPGKQMEEWQIIEGVYGRKKGYFAFSMLAPAIRSWKRLNAVEDSMVVARLTRAYDKLIHHVPVDKSFSGVEIINTIRRYKDAMTKKKMAGPGNVGNTTTSMNDNPLSVSTDIFLPDDGSKRGDVKLLTSNNVGLMRLEDVYYLRERILARMSVPIKYMQIMSSQKTHLRAGGSLTDEEKQFTKVTQRLNKATRAVFHKLCDRELLLNGIVPTEDLYRLEGLIISTIDEKVEADTLLTLGQAAEYFVSAFGVLPHEFLADKFLRLTPDQKTMLTKFFGTNGDRIVNAMVKAIELEGEPKAVAKPTTKPKAKIKQSKDIDELVSVEDAVELFTELIQRFGEDDTDLLNTEAIRSKVREDLAQLVES